MFIMFPGNGASGKSWNNIEHGNECLTKKLSKFGKIYTFTPLYNNIWYYAKGIWNDKKSEYFGRRDEIFEDNINFDIEYFDIDKFCENIYEKIKEFSGKFVLIAHSMGAIYAYKFAEKYKERCLYMMLLDGSMVGNISLNNHIEGVTMREWMDNHKYLDDISNDELHTILEKVKEDDKQSIQKISTLSYYKIQKQKILMNS